MNKKLVLPLIGLLILAAAWRLAVSEKGLWRDEGVTAWFASQTSAADLYACIRTTDTTESLMPGYDAMIWLWVRFFGDREIMLRLLNPLIGLVAASVTLLVLKGSVFRIALVLQLATSPFLWYYMDEGRPYIVLFSFSLVAIALIRVVIQDPSRTRYAWGLGIFLCVGCLISVALHFFLLALLVYALVALRMRGGSVAAFFAGIRKPLLMLLSVATLTGVHYLFNVLRGAGGVKQTPTIANLGFIFYELLGFSGLGPDRDILRANPHFNALYPFLIPLSTLFVVIALTAILALGLRKEASQDSASQAIPFIVAFFIGLFYYAIVAYIEDSRLLGRHVIFLLPFLFYFVASVAEGFFSARTNVRVLMLSCLALIPVVWLWSAINLRWNDDYAQEDYSTIAKYTRSPATASRTVLWNADPYCGSYYGIRFNGFARPASWSASREAILLANVKDQRSLDTLLSRRDTMLLVTTYNTDAYDHYGVIHGFIDSERPRCVYSVPDFQVFEIPGRRKPM